jgi:UDP-N-acetylmuramyl pentapeptide synthase
VVILGRTNEIGALPAPGDVVLVKGSNGVGLQEVATRPVAERGQA